jgi:hypothetical protein
MAGEQNPYRSLWIIGGLLGVCALIAGVFAYKVLPGLTGMSMDAAARNDLQMLRGEIKAHYILAGRFPETLDVLASHKVARLPLPVVKLGRFHGESNQIQYVPRLESNDAGGWGYVSDPGDANFGRLFINCTHPDSEGVRWMDK